MANGRSWDTFHRLRRRAGTPPTNPLPAGKTVTVSDAILVFHDDAACDEQDTARRFLQLLGAAYRQIEPPSTEYRDWVARADRTLRDLETAPEATIRHYGHTYIHPYTAAEYPGRDGPDVDHRVAARLCGLDEARHPVLPRA